MLSLMRKHAQSWLIKVALGAIIVVFIFWYGWTSKTQQSNRIAAVNGPPIVTEEFRVTYNQLMQAYRMQFGEDLDQELIERLNPKKQALDQLINRRLLLQEAERLGFQVTDEELLRAIQGVPAFQRDGRFHPQIYQRVLAANRLTPEMYEESKKYELLMEMVESFIVGGVKVSKAELRWRTALILRELEFEIAALEGFKPDQERLTGMMAEKVKLEHALSLARLGLQRRRKKRRHRPQGSLAELENEVADLRNRLLALDGEIVPLVQKASALFSERWGSLLRSGNDKNHLARQVEQSADIYTSRISNFLFASPFAFLRSSRGSMPHDPSPPHPADL